MHTRTILVFALLLAASCRATPTSEPPTLPGPTDDVVVAPPATPADGEVMLPAAADWRATLIHAADSGVWYLHVDKVVPTYGQKPDEKRSKAEAGAP
mgnify:CR=1 FL=1